jgi:hypothetical protein
MVRTPLLRERSGPRKPYVLWYLPSVANGDVMRLVNSGMTTQNAKAAGFPVSIP